MIIWGGREVTEEFVALWPSLVARYAPATGVWTTSEPAGAPAGKEGHTSVWTGTEMIVCVGGGTLIGLGSDGGRYNPATDSWLPVSKPASLSGRVDHSMVSSGSEVIVWGGSKLGVHNLDSGGVLDLGTGDWSSTSLVNAPEGRDQHSAVWSGSEMIVWGGLLNGNWAAKYRGTLRPNCPIVGPYRDPFGPCRKASNHRPSGRARR